MGQRQTYHATEITIKVDWELVSKDYGPTGLGEYMEKCRNITRCPRMYNAELSRTLSSFVHKVLIVLWN